MFACYKTSRGGVTFSQKIYDDHPNYDESLMKEKVEIGSSLMPQTDPFIFEICGCTFP